jgi:hypothetical protein
MMDARHAVARDGFPAPIDERMDGVGGQARPLSVPYATVATDSLRYL